ncbi:MAG: hypothetical protein D6814_08910 [Calditrichaeota bacterium]|nr:MAG: hypothetical protein D6814_08910 [Calditrichota bacterium]
MRLDYWLKLTSSPVQLALELAGADGKRYRCRIPVQHRNTWQALNLPLSRFKSNDKNIPAKLEIQAINVIAEFSRGDASSMHYFAIDNLVLTGWRQAQFEVRIPETRSYRNWNLLFCQKHFRPGDVLDLDVVPEVGPLQSVTAQLTTIDGKIVAEGLELMERQGHWKGQAIYRFSKKEAAGPLSLVVRGVTQKGEQIQSIVRLWVIKIPKSNGHPRLFFLEKDRRRLQDRIKTPKGHDLWQKIEQEARKARTMEVPEQSQIELFPKEYLLQQLGRYFAILRTRARYALLNAWVYFISGDTEAGDYARQALIKMAGWKQWVHPWFQTQGRQSYYPVGITALELGITYDLVYPLLSPEMRAQIRKGILQNGIINAFNEYFVHNRIPNHTSNWISHNTAGPWLALMAFYGDSGGGEAPGNGEPYFSGLAEKFLAFMHATMKPDGSYGEGFGYQNFTMETAWPALAALKHAFGVDLLHPLHLDRAYLFPLYISVHNGKELLDMGDSHSHRRASSNWAWLAWQTRDPLLKWFYDQAPGQSWEDFLWLDPLIPKTTPDSLPPLRVFPDKGNVVFRTGWSEENIVFVYRAGPNFNHTHADQGNFLLWAYGENLIAEAGPAHYYNDPYYWSYFIQSAGHNTLLIDDNPESQEFGDFSNEVAAFKRRARIQKTFLANPVSYIESELSPLYREQLQQYTRKIFFLFSGYLVIADKVRSHSGPHSYQWQLFPPQKQGLSVYDTEAIYQGRQSGLRIQVVTPENPDLKIKDVPIPINDYARVPEHKIQPRAVLQVCQKVKTRDQDFVVVLMPYKLSKPQVATIKAENLPGFKKIQIGFPKHQDEIYLSNGNRMDGAISTDGQWVFVRRNKDTIQALSVENARFMDIREQNLFKADGAVDIGMTRDPKGENWQIQAKTPTRVWIQCNRDVRLQLKGNARQLERSNGDKIGIEIKGGKVEARIESNPIP